VELVVQGEILASVEGVDLLIRQLQLAPTHVQLVEVDLLTEEIIGHDPQGVTLDPGVDVLGHEGHIIAQAGEVEGGGENAVVRDAAVHAAG
jgi:hypothetical protein